MYLYWVENRLQRTFCVPGRSPNVKEDARGETAGSTQRECGQSDPVHSKKLFGYFFSEKVAQSSSLSSLRTAVKASLGRETEPSWRIFFLPSFCFSSSFFLRVMSPP